MVRIWLMLNYSDVIGVTSIEVNEICRKGKPKLSIFPSSLPRSMTRVTVMVAMVSCILQHIHKKMINYLRKIYDHNIKLCREQRLPLKNVIQLLQIPQWDLPKLKNSNSKHNLPKLDLVFSLNILNQLICSFFCLPVCLPVCGCLNVLVLVSQSVSYCYSYSWRNPSVTSVCKCEPLNCTEKIFLKITQNCKISKKGKELNQTQFTYGLFLARAIYR